MDDKDTDIRMKLTKRLILIFILNKQFHLKIAVKQIASIGSWGVKAARSCGFYHFNMGTMTFALDHFVYGSDRSFICVKQWLGNMMNTHQDISNCLSWFD